MTEAIYKDAYKQCLHENACDCLYYGFGKDVWNVYVETDKKLLDAIWNKARERLSQGYRY